MSANANEPPEGQRRRIIIPLHRETATAAPSGKAPQSGAKPRSRAGKVLAVLAILVVVMVIAVAGGVFLWWQHYTTTPTYSLALLVDAAQRNDMATVDTIVDTDQVVDNLARQVIDKAAGRYGIALGGLARKQIESLAPKLSGPIKQTVRDTLATRVKEISESGNRKPFIVLAVALPYFVNVAVSGDSATATAQVHNQQVELDMRRADNAWKVVAFRDDALVQRLIDQVIKDLPVIGQGDELDIRKQFRKSTAPSQLRPPSP